MSGELPGNYGSVNQGSNLPDVNDRGIWWLRENSDGSPDGAYKFWNGQWRRRATLPGPGVICLWMGTPGDVSLLDGGDTDPVTIYSGPFWEIVSEFAARFPVGVGTFESAGAVAVGDTGGKDQVSLTTAQLPEDLGSFVDPVTKAFGKTTGVGGAAIGGAGPWQDLAMADFIKGGNGDAHENRPPYIGVYFIRRTARIYVNASASSSSPSGTQGMQQYFGGFTNPNGNVIGNVQDLYFSQPSLGGDGRLWSKTAGNGTNTGWV